MPYISQLLNNKVTDSSDKVVGKLEDVLIQPKVGSFAPLEFLVIRALGAKNDKPTFVPYDFVENFTSAEISLKTLFGKIAPANIRPEEFIFLKRDVLDKQIVDIAGTRVVRVNDLRIGSFENRTCVLAIDQGFHGILRRLNLERLEFLLPSQVKLIDWRQAQFLESGPLRLNTAAENLSSLHPADLANIVEELDIKQGSRILESLDEADAAKVFEELEPNLQSVLVKYLGAEKASKILARMSSDEIVDLIKTVSSEDAKSILAEIGSGKASRVVKLMDYPDDTAGGLMTADYVRVLPAWTVAQAVEEVKKQSPTMRSILYVYAVSEDGKFAGVVSLRRLLVAEPSGLIKKLSKSGPAVSVLKPHDPLRKVVKLMTKYNLYAAAVVDKEKKMLGMVTIDDVLRVLYPNA